MCFLVRSYAIALPNAFPGTWRGKGAGASGRLLGLRVWFCRAGVGLHLQTSLPKRDKISPLLYSLSRVLRASSGRLLAGHPLLTTFSVGSPLSPGSNGA